jgi:phosphoglycolate phosphatase
MQHYNFPAHSCAEYKCFIGNGLQKLIERAAPVGTSTEIIEQCCYTFKELYAKSWRSKCCPYEGINDMLPELKKRGITLAVLSNKPHEFTKLFVEEFFPGDTFQVVFGQREGFAKKPDPAVAIEIANMLQVTTNNTLFVGDSGVDIQTGKNAQMKTAGVSWGFRPVEELLENAPDLLINHPLELIDYVTASH